MRCSYDMNRVNYDGERKFARFGWGETSNDWLMDAMKRRIWMIRGVRGFVGDCKRKYEYSGLVSDLVMRTYTRVFQSVNLEATTWISFRMMRFLGQIIIFFDSRFRIFDLNTLDERLFNSALSVSFQITEWHRLGWRGELNGRPKDTNL